MNILKKEVCLWELFLSEKIWPSEYAIKDLFSYGKDTLKFLTSEYETEVILKNYQLNY